ncbi:hypothetical protein QJS04_geneDACA023243 [Acorus gramineus]|uniref:Uncharacterized protein n=1 Tax=Acorus gramineus TaxID=55184 RepID=A0AAV9A4P2_ACOGR|nr:hypothetical protein QJS04_geneDACA023243 [Acorus gramineus]
MTRQLSMRETSLEVAWEKRRRRFLKEEAERAAAARQSRSLTDYDLNELKGSIELGFGFNEEDGGHHLCDTLPALDLYFAVNRNLSSSPSSSSSSPSDSMSSSSFGSPSPGSPHHLHDPWKICSPGGNPEEVKTRLRHWAQAVACSVKQCR